LSLIKIEKNLLEITSLLDKVKNLNKKVTINLRVLLFPTKKRLYWNVLLSLQDVGVPN
jgi:uncharacterized protein (DUF2344 family)